MSHSNYQCMYIWISMYELVCAYELTRILWNHCIVFQRWNFEIKMNFHAERIVFLFFFFFRKRKKQELFLRCTCIQLSRSGTNNRSFWEVLLIIILNDIYFTTDLASDLSSNFLQMRGARRESVLAEIIISRVHFDKAPVTTTIVENETPRSQRASATTTPLSFWKTPERKLSLTLIRSHVSAILIESPSRPRRTTTWSITANYFPVLFLARAHGFFHAVFHIVLLFYQLTAF